MDECLNVSQHPKETTKTREGTKKMWNVMQVEALIFQPKWLDVLSNRNIFFASIYLYRLQKAQRWYSRRWKLNENEIENRENVCDAFAQCLLFTFFYYFCSGSHFVPFLSSFLPHKMRLFVWMSWLVFLYRVQIHRLNKLSKNTPILLECRKLWKAYSNCQGTRLGRINEMVILTSNRLFYRRKKKRIFIIFTFFANKTV